MKTKYKDSLNPADAAYKEELDLLVKELLASELNDDIARPLLLQLSIHATKENDSITSVPKSLQFLIQHRDNFHQIYDEYIIKSEKDSYSVFLLLELISFLEAIRTPEDAKSADKQSNDPSVKYKLLLYKIEAGLVAERIISDADVDKEVQSKLMNRRINDWGNEYLTSLSTQIVSYFNLESTRVVYDNMSNTNDQMDIAADKEISVLRNYDTALVITEALKFTEAITDYYFQHGFEFEAIDILLEVDLIESIRGKCGTDYDLITRVSNYLLSISAYAATYYETRRILVVAYDILLDAGRYADALRVALKLDDEERVKTLIFTCKNPSIRRQLAFICASSGNHLNYTSSDGTQTSTLSDADINEVNNISSGEHLSGFFLTLASELDVVEPKLPKHIFKSYPVSKLNTEFMDSRMSKSYTMDSALGNLSTTMVNAFLNCGFGADLLIDPPDSDWVFRHHDYGMLCSAASVGIINLWNIDEGLSKADKYAYSNNNYAKAGSYAAYGLSSCGILSEADPIAALLMDKVESSDKVECLGAILGLAFAYAGSNREALLEVLVPIAISDESEYPLACIAMASLAIGLIFVGTGKQEASEALIQKLLDFTDNTMDMAAKCQIACGLALLHLGRMEATDVIVDALAAVEGDLGRIAEMMVEACAYAGSGDVLRTQRFLKCCASSEAAKPKNTGSDNESSDMQIVPKKDNVDTPMFPDMNAESNVHQGNQEIHEKKAAKVGFEDKADEQNKNVIINDASISIIGIAMTAIGDPVGTAMLLRMIDHPLQFGSLCERRAAPLALAIAYASNPCPQVIDILSKLTHDADYQVTINAIFGMGIVGAGTNNSRIAVLLLNLAKTHARDSKGTFIIRIAAGLLHMGKGTMTISPLHSEGFLIRKPALAGLFIVIVAALDMKNTFVGSMPFIMLFVALCIRPRWMLTLSPDLEHIQVPCRVGNMVETTGTVGKQRRISGFQTHQTPVLVGCNERAEIATDDYIPCTNVLEGIVILEKNDNVAMEE
ncbi:26S protease regulatory RPN1 unit family protein [Babesia bovis T2Bo]|uniref:Proteasome 26S regulatory subunit, putative n=1 Tax=Babesia bovis TaxID=5865 RepID=A7AS27_BABBO|nr:26S protease regulatory RPN1 unit family protein [Babesia bovis T2Bo]EDO07346.1 26S protease regulatory RPN1 unit family protein [Babesia bovis T2Bo]|eukprot:XP_001610914.1 proteasome 26S regulatory subunit [Babesia bovis T2Bo]